jgi:hypothetical protein
MNDDIHDRLLERWSAGARDDCRLHFGYGYGYTAEMGNGKVDLPLRNGML